MVSQEQAEKYVEKLTELIDENIESNNFLVKKSYAAHMANAKSSIERRIAAGEFPTVAKLRARFGITVPQEPQ